MAKLDNAIAYSLVGISVVVNKEGTKTKRLLDGGEEAPRGLCSRTLSNGGEHI